ncbi:MAG: VTT domain-containing protein, partial [Candidatus Rokubacteria bacterium]|nr:VTT domain-containing protein [Candidatus Rokubacteria bacterium]
MVRHESSRGGGWSRLFLTLLAASLGLPVPEEIPIVAAGVLASQALVRWWIALPVCLAGVLSGDVVLYWAGRRWGERLLEWRAVRRVLSPPRAAKLTQGYREHGVKIVVT